MKLYIILGSLCILNSSVAAALPASEQSFSLAAYQCKFANSDGSETSEITVRPSDEEDALAAAVISTKIINPDSQVKGMPFNAVYIGHFDEENATFKSATAHATIFINLGMKAHVEVTYENHKPVSLDGTCRNFQYESVGAHNK